MRTLSVAAVASALIVATAASANEAVSSDQLLQIWNRSCHDEAPAAGADADLQKATDTTPPSASPLGRSLTPNIDRLRDRYSAPAPTAPRSVVSWRPSGAGSEIWRGTARSSQSAGSAPEAIGLERRRGHHGSRGGNPGTGDTSRRTAPAPAPVPEPGTLLLVGLGAGIAGARRLRRR